MVYFSIWASKTLQKSSAIQKISVTLSSVIIAIIVCKLLIFSTLKLQQFSLITKFSDTYISSNSRKFYFRDEKHFVGLTDCLAYDTRKLDFAFNSSFTAVNVAKIMCRECNISIGRLKVLKINADYDQRIIDVFENNPNTQLNHEIVNEKLGFAADIA